MTERVHQIREQQEQMYRTPQWTLGVSLSPVTDHDSLRLRARYAYAMPGMEIQ